MGYELVAKPKQGLRKRRTTKIDEYDLANRVINYIAENKSYPYIAKKLVNYVRNRVNNPDKEFSITGQSVKMWWMSNSKEHNDIVNIKRNALIAQRHHRVLDKGMKVRTDVQDNLRADARKASNAAETAYEHEAASRIREKIVKVQESAEKAIASQSPNLNVTQVFVNPLTEFSKKMQEKLSEIEEKEKNTVDIEYEEVEDDDDDDDEIGDDEEDEEE